MKNDDKKTLDQNESNKPDESEKPQSESAPDKDTAEEKDELTMLKEENEAIIKELDEYKDKYLRLLAEYDNYRKRAAKEKAEIYPEATARTIEAFLPLADNFERAAAVETSDEKFKSGIMMIYSQLVEVLKTLDVETIDRVGEEFDPNLENAVSTVTDEKLGQNVVAQVYQKGYKRGDKIIRHAMVSVANCG
ncbi:MAG TPA: nucleotide exchange factor GrpE [Candidatus Faeciplasma gallinarum]|uniref:Protein GrpE n=1 Tax=Candidatus Faeciplasma gallinarum TaxID=2840799 RepID=A0A9D1ENB3_9FIRM|nr:nucleotide exchange factor GrpE [Candidatus Faeciplasma gallinarum]